MPILLTHLAESLIAELANAERRKFLDACGLTEMADLSFVLGATEIATAEAKLAPFGGRAFDGASRVDVVVRLRRDAAVAFELKLGETRLDSGRVDEEWLKPCKASHEGTRWSGNMMAILDRQFPEPVADSLGVVLHGERVPLLPQWFVLARKSTIARWEESRPKFSSGVRPLSIENIVAACGGKTTFNEIARKSFPANPYEAWLAS